MCVLSATMLRRARAGLVGLVAAVVASCGGVGAHVVESGSGSGDDPTAAPVTSPTPPLNYPTRVMTAHSAAVAVGYAVPNVTGLVMFTVRTDPQHLLGRPDGYVAAIVVLDGRLSCDTLGVACGAEIEQWPSEVAAQRRSTFWPLLTHEYHYRYGAVLIRVSGALSPAAALEYDRALWQG